MKRKGFTLIELVVVVAIILLLAATLAPKLRKEVAKARDAKAVGALGAMRTANGVFIADQGLVPYIYISGNTATSSDSIIYGTAKDSEYVENSVVSFLDSTANDAAALTSGKTRHTLIPVGGSQPTGGGTVTFGGNINLTGDSEGDYILNTTNSATAGARDTKGNAWASY